MSETIEMGGGVRAVVGRTWVICQEHRKTVDDYSRAFPPAMETAEKASLFLIMMGDGEALQASPTIKCPACAIGRDRIEDADYACLRAVRCALPPDAVPLDIVVRVCFVEDWAHDKKNTLFLRSREPRPSGKTLMASTRSLLL